MVDVKDLLIFQTVTKHGNVTRAAEELCYVQSNVTGRISKLESELGTTLFHRHGRGVVTTSAGETLLQYAEKVLHLITEAKRVIQDEENINGELSIGATDITTAVRLPPVLSIFHKKYPNVRLSFKTGYTKQLINAVLKYEIDGAFITDPVNHPELLPVPIVDERLVLIHTLKSQIHSISDLNQKTLLVFGRGCTYRLTLEKCLQDHGISPSNKIEFNTIDGMLGCVKAGLGVAVVSETIYEELKENKARVSCLPMPDGYSKVQTVFIRRNNVYEFKALNNFLNTACTSMARPS